MSTVGYAVDTDQLRVHFQDKVAVDDVRIRVQDGEFVCIVGPSGCGKTTLLNTVSGLVEPSSGRIEVLGTDPIGARKDLGYMLARDALLPWRSARKNVEFGLELRGWDKAKRRAASEHWLDVVGLSHASSKYPWQLSQGMRQRVALARTFAMEPQLLLMDEPFAALDAQTREDLQAVLQDLWVKRRASVVFITHDLVEAVLLADRVIQMKDGRVIGEYKVPFERPRKLDELTLDSEFRELCNALRNSL